jgi:hypothetical protein
VANKDLLGVPLPVAAGRDPADGQE